MVDLKEILKKTWRKSKDFRSKTIFGSIIICGSTTSKEYLDEQIEETHIHIPDVLRKVLIEYGGNSFIWKVLKSNNENRVIFSNSGMIATNYFDYGGFQNRITYKNNTDIGLPFYPKGCSNDELKYWKQFYILDDLYFGTLVFLKTDNTGEEHELFLFEHPNKLTKSTVNLEQYLECIEKTMGMYCWQEYVTEESYKLDGAIPDNFHENMTILFPEEDLSMFRPKWAGLWRLCCIGQRRFKHVQAKAPT